MAVVRIFVAIAGLCAILARTATADIVNVLVVDRELDAQGQSGFSDSGRYGDAYTDLTNVANFGTGGVVDHSLNFLPGVANLNNLSLDDVQLVIFAHSDGQSPTPRPTGEVAKLRDYVDDGGRLITLGHSMTYHWGNSLADDPINLSEELATRFPQPHSHSTLPAYRYPENGLVDPNTGDPSAVNGPIINGDFGVVDTVSSTRNTYWTGSTGASSGTFAFRYRATDAFFYSDGLYGTFGVNGGRYMMIGSEDLAGAQYSTDIDNQRFFMNSVAWVTEGAQSSASTPEPSSLVLLSGAGIGALIYRRKRGKAARDAT